MKTPHQRDVDPSSDRQVPDNMCPENKTLTTIKSTKQEKQLGETTTANWNKKTINCVQKNNKKSKTVHEKHTGPQFDSDTQYSHKSPNTTSRNRRQNSKTKRREHTVPKSHKHNTKFVPKNNNKRENKTEKKLKPRDYVHQP